MNDLVERLSKDATHGVMATWALCHEAAAEILRLRAEVKSARLAALREAGAEIVDELSGWDEAVPEHQNACFALQCVHDAITTLIAQEEADVVNSDS